MCDRHCACLKRRFNFKLWFIQLVVCNRCWACVSASTLFSKCESSISLFRKREEIDKGISDGIKWKSTDAIALSDLESSNKFHTPNKVHHSTYVVQVIWRSCVDDSPRNLAYLCDGIVVYRLFIIWIVCWQWYRQIVLCVYKSVNWWLQIAINWLQK